jgi:AcrR family transcriptional regulator
MESINKGEQPLTRTQKARRDDILAAAIALLDREGVPGASVERIAEEAGTSKGTVLYHFGTKEAVYRAVVESLFSQGGEYMTERIMAQPTHRGKLSEYLASNLRFIADHREHVSAVHRIQEAFPGERGPDTAAPLLPLFTSGQKAGEFGPFDAGVMALALRAVVDGASFYLGAHPELDVDLAIREVVQIFDRATSPSWREKE